MTTSPDALFRRHLANVARHLDKTPDPRLDTPVLGKERDA